MKTIVLISLLFVVGCGCKTTHEFALQEGDKIFFMSEDGTPSQERANEFREDSNNDYTNRGSVVKITEPTKLAY